MVQHQSVSEGLAAFDERLPEPVVVLGGGGFIGSNLVKRLIDMGYLVCSVDVEFPEWRFAPFGRKYYDLTRPDEAEAAVAGAGTVFHLAADMGGVEFFHSDKDFGAAQTNALITLNVVNACVKSRVQRLVYTSSACAAATEHQDNVRYPYKIREYDITWGTPDARYGAEKRYGAYVVANAPIDGRVAVLHTVYGPGQEYVGVRRKFPSAVCTNAIKSVKTGSDLVLFGDGSQVRTYLYIDDAVERLYKLALAKKETIGDGVFNIGSTEEWSCKNVAEFVLDTVIDLLPNAYDDVDIVYDPSKPIGVASRSCDLDKWERYFGYPYQTALRDGFTEFIHWLVTKVGA